MAACPVPEQSEWYGEAILKIIYKILQPLLFVAVSG